MHLLLQGIETKSDGSDQPKLIIKMEIIPYC